MEDAEQRPLSMTYFYNGFAFIHAVMAESGGAQRSRGCCYENKEHDRSWTKTLQDDLV